MSDFFFRCIFTKLIIRVALPQGGEMGQWAGRVHNGGPLWRGHVCWLVSHSSVLQIHSLHTWSEFDVSTWNTPTSSPATPLTTQNIYCTYTIIMSSVNCLQVVQLSKFSLLTSLWAKYHISPFSSFFIHNMSTPSITAHGSLAWWRCVNIHTHTTLIRWQPSARGWHRVTSPWLTPPGIFIFPQIASFFHARRPSKWMS